MQDYSHVCTIHKHSDFNYVTLSDLTHIMLKVLINMDVFHHSSVPLSKFEGFPYSVITMLTLDHWDLDLVLKM